MTHTLEKIGLNFVLKEGGRKVRSTTDAFLIVTMIKTNNLLVTGTECLPDYYKSMLSLTP